MMVTKKEEVDTDFCVIDEEDVELYLGRKKITKDERDDIERVGDFEI